MDRADMVYDVFCGVDVGKSSNHVVALDRVGDAKLLSRKIPQDESEMRAVLTEASGFGRILVTVDQCGSFGRLTVAVARDMGIDVAHIPPASFKRIAETYGEDKTDAGDAFIIADASRSAPRLLTLLGKRDEAIEEIKILTSRRNDVVKERTRYYNRLHDLIHQACPALEAVFSKGKLHNDLELRLVARYGGPEGFRRAGRARVSRWAGELKYHKTDGPRKAAEVFDALGRQTVSMPGAAVIEGQVKTMAERIIDLTREEKAIRAQLEERADALPESKILRSVPGIGAIFSAVIAAEIGSIARFPSAHHLASYGGVAPRREESGTSVHKTRKRKGGNRRLKNAFLESARMAVLNDEKSRVYYEGKVAEGKKHRQALRALARRRVGMIFALLSTGSFYDPGHAAGPCAA